ncbi:unnamed protein product [Orchesella dallaii]|uniref:Uncharacterized protein n=1 Tax=Orchesella dallaii TaxID=48710 RepID=A0ABP1QU86_9HEXA
MSLTALFPVLQQTMSQCPVRSDVCFPSPLMKMGQASTALALLLSSGSMTPTKAMFSNISVAPSSSWYFSLTPFESILLGMIVLKLMLLRYLTILPIDINNLANKDYFNFGKKRRKRDVNGLDEAKFAKEKERLAEIMFTVIRRLDMQDCFLRMLCELQVHSIRGKTLPREVKLTLSALSK